MIFSLYFLSSLYLFFFGFLFFCFGLYFLLFNLFFVFDWEFLMLNSCSMSLSFIFDWMSLMFVSCVFFISSMVLLYSYSYMLDDLNSIRFLYLVLLFIFSMMMLILSPNMISILIGWDGLGLVSYCLVIYFQNSKSYNAGYLTILMNRVGDVAILLIIAWMLNFGSWLYFSYLIVLDYWVIYMFVLVVLACFTKSAQIPFSSWLPAAMAAPTPVSALVHSSTLVTAGIYLLIRFNSLVSFYNCDFFIILSLLTMFMSGIGASFEYDLKKIIALSTLSQLGLMMSLLFFGYPFFSYFHLLTHAFFKSLLFLCAGLIIHIMNDSQDIRHMGFISKYLPFTSICFLVSSLSLCGFPFLSGFYSKDLILEIYSFGYNNYFIYLLYYVSVGLTVMYSFRLIYYLFLGYGNFYLFQSYSEDKFMILSMLFLVFLSISGGSMIFWFIFPVPMFIVLPFHLKFMSLMLILMGMFFGLEISKFYLSNFLNMSLFYIIFYFGSMWFLINFNSLFNRFYYLSFNCYYVSEVGWCEYYFSNFFLLMFVYMSKLNLFIQNNNLKLFMISFLFIILFMLF